MKEEDRYRRSISICPSLREIVHYEIAHRQETGEALFEPAVGGVRGLAIVSRGTLFTFQFSIFGTDPELEY
ncbi:hypothetical protein [Haloferula sp.]|uniref:hypothetical protein n=1 Tax=Haloferula sp. TaxID=2497595 RepID=UPI003C7154E0